MLTREDLVGSLFFPRPDHAPAPDGATDLLVPVREASIQVRIHGSRHRSLLLVFPGNGETVPDWDPLAARFTAFARLAVCGYRGYGRSTGAPTLERLFEDALAVFDAVDGQQGLAPLVMGRSLGSAAAWHVVDERPGRVRGVVIDSGFSDLDAFVRRRDREPSCLLADERTLIDPIPKARRCAVPVLLLHGEADALIASREAEAVARACPAGLARLERLSGRGHNDLMLDERYWSALGEHLARFAPHPLLAITLDRAALRQGFRVVVDIEARTSFHDFATLAEARAYAADVRLESDAPDRTLALLFDALGQRVE